MPTPRAAHRAATRALSICMVGIGVAMIATTIARGGGPLAVGVLLGLIFTAVGAGRLYLLSRT
jgi:hypothetical protein